MSTNYNMGDRPQAIAPTAPVDSLLIATFGDSTANPGTIRAAQDTDQETRNIPLGTTTTVTFQHLDRWTTDFYYPAARLVAVGGISGQGTAAMIARETATPSATRRSISDVMAKAPKLVILRGGSINDISGFTTATLQSEIDAVYERHLQILWTFISAGAFVLDCGIDGFAASAGVPNAANTAFIQATLVRLNARYRAAVEALGPRLARWLEPAGLTHDGTGAYKPGCSADGIHLSLYGALLRAQAEAKILESWFGPSVGERYTGPNLLNTSAGSLALFPSVITQNPIGVGPVGFNTTRVNGEAANSQVEMRNGRRWWTVVFTPNNAGIPVMGFNFLGASGGAGVQSGATYPVPIVANGVYGFELDFFVETLDGSPLDSITTYRSRIDLRNASGGRAVYDREPNPDYRIGGATGVPSRLAGHLAFSPFQVSDASSALTAASTWGFFVSGSPTQTLRIGVSNPTIVRVA